MVPYKLSQTENLHNFKPLIFLNTFRYVNIADFIANLVTLYFFYYMIRIFVEIITKAVENNFNIAKEKNCEARRRLIVVLK